MQPLRVGDFLSTWLISVVIMSFGKIVKGKMLIDWAEDNNINLIFDTKERFTFKSAEWNRDFKHDPLFHRIKIDGQF